MSQLSLGWKVQFNLLWLGQALVMAMLSMSLPYWPLYIEQLGNYSLDEVRFWSAAIYVAPFVTSIISSPLWGKIGDKYGYKPMVVRACLGLFITQTLILLFTDVFLIFLFRLLQGVLAGFIVAAQAWALAISPLHERGATLGRLQSATAVGGLLGPLLGGVIATFAGYQAIFSSSSFICGLITILFFFFLQDVEKTKECEAVKSATSARLKLLSNFQKQIFAILLIIIIVQLVKQMITPVLALFVTEQLGGNDIMVGLLFAAPGLMVFITAPYWGKFFDKIIQAGHSTHYFVAGLLLISAILQAMQALTDALSLIFVLRILWGVCLGALLPVLLRLLVDNGEERERGTFLGFGNSATKLGNVLGIILGAFIEAYLGYSNSFLMMAMFYLISCAIVIAYLKSVPAPIINNSNVSK